VLFALIIATCIAGHCSAQITLSAASYPATLTGTDSLKVTSYISPFPSMGAASSTSWDMTITTDSTPVLIAYRVPVAVYQYADSGQYHIGSFGYQGNTPVSVIGTGVDEYGINIRYTEYALWSITGGTFDSLFIPTQNVLNTSPFVRIAFPATGSSSWQSVFYRDVTFELSIAAYSLLHTPFVERKYTIHADSVTGWGQMRVKNAAGGPSDYFDVLQVQSTIITTDSFLMGGSAAPGAVLTMIGLTQGHRDTTYIQYYYREQEVTPMAKVEYSDATFSMPRKVTTHMQHLINPPTSVPMTIPGKLVTYPNPVSEMLYVQLPAVQGDSYTLTGIGGSIVQSGELHAHGGEMSIAVAAHIAAGIYYLHVAHNGTAAGTATIVVSK